jgi:uncharacterized membrane protein YcaP (DUF421 family)
MIVTDVQTLAEIALRTFIIYVAVLAGIRLSGKREIGELTPFDLVILLLLSNAVQNAMTGPDDSVSGGLVAAATLLLANAAVARLRLRSPRFRRFVEGVPVVLVAHGGIQFRNLERERITVEELKAAIREHEAEHVADVELAMLETDGSISVIRRAGDKGSDGGERFVRSQTRLVRTPRKKDR